MGSLATPYGVATDSSGNVYVTDTDNHRIQKFDSSGAYLTQWGSLNYPSDVAVTSSGTVYVADTNNHRIQRFGTPSPEIAVQGNGVTIASGDSTPSTTDDTDLGSVAVGSALTHTFTIINSGQADLTGVAVTISGASAFSVGRQPTGTISAGSSSTTQIRFAPSATGVVTATVSIASNDNDENPYTFMLAGTGTPPAIDIVVEQSVVGDRPDDDWQFSGPGGLTFTIPAEGGVYTLTNILRAQGLGLTQTAQIHFPTASVCTDGSRGGSSIVPQPADTLERLRCTFTSTNQCTVEPKVFFAFTGGALNATEGSGLVSLGSGLTRFAGTPAGNPTGSGNPGASFSGFASGATLNPANNDYLQFRADLTDRYNIQLRLFVKRESSGAPRSYALSYSADGVTFQPIRTAALVNNTAWQTILADLGQLGGLNNNPNATFRLYGFNATGATARLTVDDIRLSGAIPSSCAEVQPPLTGADVVTTTEDTPVTVAVLDNDSAQGNDLNPSSLATATAPANGTAAVVSGSVRYTPTLNFTGVDSLTYRICDVTQACATGQITVTVTAVNDTPVASDDSITVAEDSVITATLTASDGDGDPLTYAIATQPANGTISVSSNTATYTPTADYNGPDSFTFTASDGNATSNTATITITVTAVNDTPVASDDNVTVAEDGVITVTLAASDVDGDALTYAIADQPTNGTVSVNGATATYTPTADYNGSDSFTFSASDGSATATAATVTITVTAVNDAPTASDGSDTVAEDGVLTVSLSASDVEGDALTYAIDTQPANGTVSVSGNTATYTPTADYNGPDSFTFTASADGATSTAATISLTVTAAPDLVVALVTQPAYTTTFSYSGDGAIGSFTLPDGGSTERYVNLSAGSYTLSQTANPHYATSVACDNGATGESSVTVSVSGDDAPTCTFTNVELVDLIVTQVITGAAPDEEWAFSGPDGVTFTIPAAGGVYTLTDVLGTSSLGLTQTVAANFTSSALCSDGASGTTSVFPTLTPGVGALSCVFTSVNACVLTPAATFAFTGGSLAATTGSGSASVGSGLTRFTGTVTGYPQGSAGRALSVSGFANNTTLNTATNDYLEFRVDLSNRYNAHLHFAVKRESAGAPRTYALYASADGVTFAPVLSNAFNNDTIWHPISLDLSHVSGLNDNATATFRLYGYRATNAAARLTLDDVAVTATSGSACAEAHPPLVVSDTYTTSEESGLPIDVLAGASDADDDLDATSLVTVTNPTQGVLSLAPGGLFHYTPTLNFAGTDSFRYQLCDNGLGCATGVITLTVTPVNDTPVATNGSATTNEDTAATLTLSASDVEDDALTYAIATQPANGTVSVSDNTATYTPTADYNGSDSFTFTASDGSLTSTVATITLTVTAVNDAPTASDDSITVAEDGVITVTLTASDVEGDALTYAIADQPTNGTVSVSGNTAIYTPTADYNDSDSFTFTASDGNATATAATVSITVTAVNDAPTASDDSVTVAEDGVLTVSLSASDVEGDALTYAVADQLTNGTVSVSGSTATYTPTADYNGSDSFTFTASDGSATSTVATVNITVTAVNDAPVASDDSATVSEDGVLTVSLSASDVEGDALTYAIADQPTNGTVSVSGNTATYTPTADYNGSDSFTFTASDGSATSTAATVSITVTAAPDLVVALVTQPAYTTTFTYSGTGAIGSFVLPTSGSTQRHVNLSAGSYTLQQTANAQYVTSVACDNDATGEASVTFSVSGDDSRTCTFTNRELVDLVVTQVVEGDAPATTWAFSGPGGVTFTLPAEGSVYTLTDVVGVNGLGLTQTLPVNFTTTALCSDGATGTTSVFPMMTAGVGQVSCVFTSVNQCTVTPAVLFPFTGGSLTAASGTGTVTVGAGLAAASATDAISYSGFASGATLTRSNNDYLQVRADLTGRYNIQLKFLVKRESQLNAPRNVAIDLSADGVTFVPFYSGALPNDTVWNAVNLDLSRIGALNNNAQVTVRIYGFNALQSTARLSFDDLSLGGALPSTCAEATAPVAVGSAITLTEETPTAITLTASDADGDALTYAIATQPAHGMVSLSGSTATYTPTVDYNGSDSFTFTASDDSLTSAVATVSITVTPVNDAPQTVLTPTISGGDATFVFAPVDVDSSNFTFTCALDSATPAPCTSPHSYSGLTPGDHLFTVYTTDQAGAMDATPASHTWTIPAATLTIVLDAQPDLPTNLGFGGSLRGFILDDPTVDDGDAYTNTRNFTVAPGVYAVHRNNTDTWYTADIACTPASNAAIDLAQRSTTLTLAAGDHVTCTFTVVRNVTITARAFNDLVRTSANLGTRNPGDPWLEGWTMTLATAPTATVESKVTAVSGGVAQAGFTSLRPGSYTVCVTLPTAGWTFTTPTAHDPAYGKPCKSVTLTPGQSALLLFGAYEATVTASDAVAPQDETITDEDTISDQPYDPAEDETAINEDLPQIFLPLITR